jgi:uncharacterized protein
VRAVLVDAGPLVALVDAGDDCHTACVAALKRIRSPLLTVWPAVTEAMYLLGRIGWDAQSRLWGMLDARIELRELVAADLPRMRALMEKYRDLPMDLADAALVAFAEREGIKEVFTTDRDDFTLYRPEGLGRFRLIP